MSFDFWAMVLDASQANDIDVIIPEQTVCLAVLVKGFQVAHLGSSF